MTAPIAFVPKPSVADNIKSDVVVMLREVLAEAERGEIDAVIVIKRMPDGYWADRRSGVIHFSDAIGKLEIVKQSWIASYLADCAK
jgi:hypothetical protein